MANIVFIPGTLCDARLFGPQIEYLSAHKYHVMAMSIAHHYSIQEMAENILDHAPKYFHLVGLSLGGIVAMEIMRLAPERIQSTVLINTNAQDESIEKQLARQPQIEEARAGNMMDLLIKDVFPKYTYRSNVEIFQLCIDMAETLGANVFIQQSTAVSLRRDQKETLKMWDKPTLIICGENDVVCPVSNHQLMKDLMPSSKMEIIPESGHLLTLEQPIKVNEILFSWFNKII